MAGRTTACPKCKTQLDISGFKPGQRIRCGSCNTVLRIPGEDVAVAPGARPVSPAPPPPPPTPQPRPAAAAQATQKITLPPPEKKDDLIGYAVGGEFEIVRKLGEGGYGAVYEAVDRTLRRRVAVKLMLPVRASNKEYVSKFYREARTAGQLSHPNIVAIHDVRNDDNLKTHYLAMEYVEGTTVHDILQEKGWMSVEESVDIISQCCRGLAQAHSKNIIHRDIKPGNIMVTPGKGVKIADFGLAKVFDAEEQAKSMVIGTPFFMPPEQFEGKAKDGRTDIYALGVTFYYMLTLKRPFTGSTPAQILVGIMTKDPVPIMEIRPELPESLWKVVRKMIHRDLDQRYQDCNAILDDLARIGTGDEGEKAFCPECGVPNDPEAGKCKGCGTSMRERCPVCGAEEDAGVKFCGDCGSNIPLEKEVKTLAQEGKALLAAGDFKTAIERLKLAQEKSPVNAEVISALREAEGRRDGLGDERSAVSALLAAGDFDRAGQRLKTALETYPGDDHLVHLQDDLERARQASRRGQGKFTVQALLNARRFPEAREAAERLMMSEGRTPELVELLDKAKAALAGVDSGTAKARAFDSEGSPAAALEAWRAVLQLSPDLGEARRRVREIEEAMGAVDALLESAGKSLEAGNPEEAVHAIASAGDRASADPRIQELLGRAQAAEEEMEDAVAAVRKAAGAGDLPSADAALGKLRGRFAGAAVLPALEEEVRAARRAKDLEGKVEAVARLVAAKKWVEARDAASEVLAEDPGHAAAKEADEKARFELARAADLVSRAGAAEEAGDLAAAEEAWLEASEANPEDGSAAEGLERVSALRKRLDALRTEAAAAEKEGDASLAVERLQAILELCPSDGDAAKRLKAIEERAAGRLKEFREVEELLAAGEVEEALDRAKEIGKRFPGDGEAKDILGIAEHLIATRDLILSRVERLLASPGREREAAKLAQVALRVLPGDSRAATLLAKARSTGPEHTP